MREASSIKKRFMVRSINVFGEMESSLSGCLKGMKVHLEVRNYFSQRESLSSSSSHLHRSPLNGGILSISIPPVFPVANVRIPAIVADEREVPLRKLCLS